MKVGDLAKKTGLSVRALHHYDEVGLLKPSARDESGHRIYTESDVCRLQQIVSLRDVGLTLEEVRFTLGDPAVSILSVVERHMESLEDEIHRQQRLFKRLSSITNFLRTKEKLDLNVILETIRDVVTIEKHLSSEHMDAMSTVTSNLGSEQFKRIGEEMTTIISGLRAAMEKSIPPSDPDIQAMAKRWQEFSNILSGGDVTLKKSFQDLYEQKPEFGIRHGVDEKMLNYVREAIRIALEKGIR